MSNFVPTKQNLREALLFCFQFKKNASESHPLLVEAYGKHAFANTNSINTKTQHPREQGFTVYMVGSERCCVL
jgi:hypothetical protein